MSREQIFANIGQALGRNKPDQASRDAALDRIKARRANLIPARAQLPRDQQIALFKQMASAAAAELIELDSLADLPQAAHRWLRHQSISELVSGSDAELSSLDWSPYADLQVVQRVAQAGDRASLTGCLAGIAETGTLMLHSGADSPTTLNFLPDCHLVVLKESQIVGVYEEAWALLRDKFPEQLPRTVNMITGPSRSADIGQVLHMGAHGPCVLVIFLIKA